MREGSHGMNVKVKAKAKEILSETPTEHGYVIRKEIWGHDGPGTEMTSAYSTIDNGYIGNIDTAKHLCETRGIAPQLSGGSVCNIGFCERDQKWYGWSHRAIFGFGVGSKIERGDCAYVPTDIEDARQDAIRFWTGDSHLNVEAKPSVDEDGVQCFDVSWTVSDSVPNKKRRGQISGTRHYPPAEFGRGEWEAKTLDDAKQMAVDFAEGVS